MKEKGFFMIEVMIIVIILSVISSILVMYIVSHHAIEYSNHLVTATFLAQKEIEILKGQENSLSHSEIQMEDSKEIDINGVKFTIETHMKTHNEFKQLQKVEVSVTWRELHQLKSISLSTFLLMEKT
ncbi:hypothetical protein [Anaerosinus massiliensis]|uniref:hypothetical protein n=1 Tax=Massilibacillus massiliensis TaxID=1806837 RepID=UPI000DA6275C|nr:hypothetical protein [Massilibacillus massiliensis]